MGNEFQNADSRHILALNACVFECGILKSIDERRNMKKTQITAMPLSRRGLLEQIWIDRRTAMC